MQDLARKILDGDTRAIARAATAIENGEAVELPPPSAESLVIGITGPPGAGKSTLVDQLAHAYRKRNQTVAIIAVDPSSAVSGGAILGDRIRMQSHHGDDGIFIRSMATRGAHGGLARATAGLVRLFRAEGRGVIFVETVGVGQGEVDVARLADITVVVVVPGMGDDVQALKAGILEVADLFVINKADHPGADKVEREISAERHAPIVKTVATTGAGIDQLIEAIDRLPRPASRRRAPGEFSIDHLGIAVHSIDSALSFYRDLLGIEGSLRETVPHEKVEVAMLPVGGPRLELLEPAAPDSVIAKFLEKRGGGLHHVALRVPDLHATVERLRTAGAKILNEPRRGAGGHEYVFVHPSSTGGVLLELIQQAEEAN